jgi:hypothetical protein
MYNILEVGEKQLYAKRYKLHVGALLHIVPPELVNTYKTDN